MNNLVFFNVQRIKEGSMPEQIIKNIVENGLGYFWFIFMAIWGGTASYISRIKRTKTGFSLIELFGEWTISGFAGMLTAYMCQSIELDFYATACAVGIAGHMGGRGLFLVESYVQNKAPKILNGLSKDKDR